MSGRRPDGTSAREVPDLLTGMATTRAIRRLADDPIPVEDLATILWHATRAPSGSNRQPARFVVLRRDDRAAPARACLARAFALGWEAKATADGYRRGSAVRAGTRKARQAAALEHLATHIETVPVIVLACLARYREPNPLEGASVFPACQNLLLAARALGYGGVLTGWHSYAEDELRSVLGIPDAVLIAATIPLGRPLGGHGPVRRRPLREVVMDGAWGEPAAWAVDPPGTLFAGGPRAASDDQPAR
jgi:nitroreductase